MNIDQIIGALKANAIDIDCLNMTLAQKKVAGIVVQGSGYIHQDHDGILIFKIYVSMLKGTSMFRYMQAISKESIGKIYTEEDYFDLNVDSVDRGLWTASYIIPSFRWVEEEQVVVTGSLSSLVTKLPVYQQAQRARIYFFDDAIVPLTLLSKKEEDGKIIHERNRATFKTNDCEFEVTKRPNEIVFNIQSSATLPDFLWVRVQEALQYLVAKPVNWRARIEQRDLDAVFEIASGGQRSDSIKISPPLLSGSIEFLTYGWVLFARYFDFVLAGASGSYFHHCSYHLSNARDASANSLDSWAAGVCVAIEGITSLIEDVSDPVQKEKTKRLQRKLRAFVHNQYEFLEFVERMNGLIGMLSDERVKDKLGHLTRSGHINPQYIKAWGKLRNRQVHPKIIDLKRLTLGHVQDLLDLVRQAEVLMWQITFHLIDYQGIFSDFSKNGGYDLANYPLAVPTNQVIPLSEKPN